MEEVNRLGWAAGAAYELFGVRFGVRVSDPALLPLLEPFLPPGRVAAGPEVEVLYSMILGGAGPRPGMKRYHVVFAGGERMVKTHDLLGALHTLEATLRLELGTRARRRLFVHGGAVGIRGGGLVLPGRSEAGKSTLTRALLAAGATYFSDEYAVLDAHRRLHPYPLRLSFNRARGEHDERISAAELGAVEASSPVPVRLVLATRYRAGAKFRPRRLSPARGMLAVLEHTVPAQFRPRSVFASLTRLVEKVPVFVSDRPDTGSVVEWLVREGWFDPVERRPDHEPQVQEGQAALPAAR